MVITSSQSVLPWVPSVRISGQTRSLTPTRGSIMGEREARLGSDARKRTREPWLHVSCEPRLHSSKWSPYWSSSCEHTLRGQTVPDSKNGTAIELQPDPEITLCDVGLQPWSSLALNPLLEPRDPERGSKGLSPLVLSREISHNFRLYKSAYIPLVGRSSTIALSTVELL